jgi:K+-transporting ATPase ATPase C chain
MSLLLFTFLTGIIYPVAVTGIAQVIFPHQANGSIITKNGKPVGSELIGQQFDDPKYLWGRLSATGPYPYNGAASSGSNLGPSNPNLMAAVESRIKALRAADPGNAAKIPVDLVTASGSGLDPHISLAAAEYQIKRVAKVRGIDEATVRDIVARNTQRRWLGVLGEPVVNVLELNLALDEHR